MRRIAARSVRERKSTMSLGIRSAFVSRLFLRGGPAAVAWFVVPIIVDAIQRTANRTRPHVSQECLERVAPAVAHRDATAAVIGEAVVASREAPLSHAAPTLVLPRPSRELRSVAVNSGCRPEALAAHASAAGRLATQQLTADDFGGVAAITDTGPPDAVRSPSREREHAEPMKASPCQVNEYVHHPYFTSASSDARCPGA